MRGEQREGVEREGVEREGVERMVYPAPLHVMPCQPQQDVVGVAVLQPVAQPSLHDAIQPSPFEVEWYVSQRRAHSLEWPGTAGVGTGGTGDGVGGEVQPLLVRHAAHAAGLSM